MNTKIRIDLSQGIIEAEGTEEFVSAIYSDFKERIRPPSGTVPPDPSSKHRKEAPPKVEPTETRRRRAGTTPTPSIARDLDLSRQDDKPSLREFSAKYRPTSNLKRNLIFVYYLRQIREISSVNVDHVFTCYRNISGLKAPVALQQSLWDTSSRYGWLDTTSLDDIKVTVPGINYLEHDMPKAGTSNDA